MKQYYECHITMVGDSEKIKKETENGGWKFSRIEGDPTLGDGVKCYATKHYNKKYHPEHITKALELTASQIAWLTDAKILRTKIELVVYDNITKNA